VRRTRRQYRHGPAPAYRVQHCSTSVVSGADVPCQHHALHYLRPTVSARDTHSRHHAPPLIEGTAFSGSNWFREIAEIGQRQVHATVPIVGQLPREGRNSSRSRDVYSRTFTLRVMKGAPPSLDQDLDLEKRRETWPFLSPALTGLSQNVDGRRILKLVFIPNSSGQKASGCPKALLALQSTIDSLR